MWAGMIYLVTFLLVIANVCASTEVPSGPCYTTGCKLRGDVKYIFLSDKEQAEISRALLNNPDQYYRLLSELRKQINE
jgi:hypothetical protein